MARPTITSVLPARGHAGGGYLVEIRGSNFRMPDAPAAPRVASPESVAVYFGEEPALGVGVAEDGLIYCLAPEHDAETVDVVVKNLSGTPARLLSTEGPFALSDGQTLEVGVAPSTALTVTFTTAQFAAIGAATAAEVAAAINPQVIASRARVEDGLVVLETDATGPAAAIRVLGGTAAAALGFPSEWAFGTEDRLAIEGETATAEQAFVFALPNLGGRGHIAEACAALKRKLQRWIHRNVHLATHTDYDAETGDLLNTAYIAKLPAVVAMLTGAPDSTDEPATSKEQRAGAEADDIVEVRPPTLVDLEFTLIAAADNPLVLANLLEVLKVFAKQATTLSVPRGGSRTDAIEYEIVTQVGSPVGISVESDNSNLQTIQAQLVVKNVRCEAMPGMLEAELPEGIEPGDAHQSTIAVGKPAETISIGITRK